MTFLLFSIWWGNKLIPNWEEWLLFKNISFLAKHVRQHLACKWTSGQEGDNYHGHLSSQQQLRLTEQNFDVYNHLRDDTTAQSLEGQMGRVRQRQRDDRKFLLSFKLITVTVIIFKKSNYGHFLPYQHGGSGQNQLVSFSPRSSWSWRRPRPWPLSLHWPHGPVPVLDCGETEPPLECWNTNRKFSMFVKSK